MRRRKLATVMRVRRVIPIKCVLIKPNISLDIKNISCIVDPHISLIELQSQKQPNSKDKIININKV